MSSKAEQILAGLGGADNVVEIEACITRLRTEVHDGSKINESALKDKPLNECIALLGGAADTKVRLELVDGAGKDARTVELTQKRFLTIQDKGPKKP